MIGRRIRWLATRRRLTAASACLVAGCKVPTGDCTDPATVTGTWTYAAVQSTPVPATISGTLVVSRQTCSDFSGTLDVVQVSERGESRRVAGQVNGRVLDAVSVQFDALLSTVPRQHLATVRGDSVVGQWLEVGTVTGGASGDFRGKRGDTQ